MNKYIAMFLALALSGCAAAQFKSSLKEKRGYSDQEISEIMEQAKEYHSNIARSSTANAFGDGDRIAAENRVRTVFCNCWKKLGERCRQPSGTLAGPERTLWLKSNAAEMAFKMHEQTKTTQLFNKNAGSFDEAECN